MGAMTEMAEAPTARPKITPGGILCLGVLLALFGALVASSGSPIGLVAVAAGGLMTQFGIIAMAVEVAIVRARVR